MQKKTQQCARISHAPGGQILGWNEAAAALYGWAPEDALGHDLFDLVPTGMPEPYEDILRVLKSTGNWSGLLLQQSKSGDDLSVKAEFEWNNGEVVQTCCAAVSDSEPLLSGPLSECLLDTYPGCVFLFDLVHSKTVLIHGCDVAGLGYSSEEIQAMGTNVLPTLLHPEDLAQMPDRFREYAQMAKGDVSDYVQRVLTKDGSWRHVRVHVSIFAWSADGTPSHLVGFAHDVTAELDSDQALHLVQEQLRLALSATGMIAWIWNYATGEVMRLGDVESIYGQIEPTADAFFRAVHPDDWHLSDKACEYAISGNHMEGVQMRIIRSDGQVRWVEERGAVQYDDQGNPSHMVGVTIDVTEQRRKDEVSRRTHRSLRLALQAARASTWQWDCLTNLIVVSDDAFELFGLPRGAPPTMDEWLARIHPQDRHHFAIEARRTANEGMDLCIDFRVVMPDGTKKPVRAVAQRAMDDNGNATEVIGVVMDLSIFRGLRRSDDGDEPEGETLAA